MQPTGAYPFLILLTLSVFCTTSAIIGSSPEIGIAINNPPCNHKAYRMTAFFKQQNGKEERLGNAVNRMNNEEKSFIIQELLEKEAEVYKLRIWLIIALMLVVVLSVLVYFKIWPGSGTRKINKPIAAALNIGKQKMTKTLNFLINGEAKYKSLVENSPTGILLLDREGNILEVNKKMLEILGSPSPEETKKINLLDYPPLKTVGLSKDILHSIHTGQPVVRRVEYRTKWEKEVVLNYTITPLMDKEEKVYNLIFNAENITESVLAERSRLESEHKYQILVENSLQAMMTVQGGRIIFANSKIEELTGYTIDEIRNAGRRWLNLLIHPDDKKRAYQNVKDALRKIEVDPRQVYKIIRKNGTTRIIETLSAVVNFHKKPAMLVVAIDITKAVTAQHNLIESEKRLREINAMKDKFFSIIAHDLKNPFSSILGFSNLLSEAYDNFTELQRKSFIKNICEASESTFKLLQNLLEWSRTQTGNIGLIPRSLDVESLVKENISILNSGFVRKNMKVQVSIPEGTKIFADENMIKLVIRNLLSNALKFTHPGGRVEVISQTNGEKTIITVKDNGVGIQEENIRRLFRIDDQLRTAGTAMESGSGLGLILCKEFIEKNQGSIGVVSSFGEGSSFFFSLPSKKTTPSNSLSS